MQERENEEVPLYLKPGSEYVVYDAGNLEAVIEHYLTHDDERLAIANAARQRLHELTADKFYSEIFESLQDELPELAERARQRCAVPILPDLTTRVWSAVDGGDSREIPAALQEVPDSPDSMFAAGLFAPKPDDSAARFDKILDLEPSHLLAGLNRAQCWPCPNKKRRRSVRPGGLFVISNARPTRSAGQFDLPHYPVPFDTFRVEWERAAWQHAGDRPGELLAKRNLIRWESALLARRSDQGPDALSSCGSGAS